MNFTLDKGRSILYDVDSQIEDAATLTRKNPISHQMAYRHDC